MLPYLQYYRLFPLSFLNVPLTLTVLNLIHRLIFYLKHDIHYTELYLRLQVKPTQKV
jgi:hypothetical protein